MLLYGNKGIYNVVWWPLCVRTAIMLSPSDCSIMLRHLVCGTSHSVSVCNVTLCQCAQRHTVSLWRNVVVCRCVRNVILCHCVRYVILCHCVRVTLFHWLRYHNVSLCTQRECVIVCNVTLCDCVRNVTVCHCVQRNTV